MLRTLVMISKAPRNYGSLVGSFNFSNANLFLLSTKSCLIFEAFWLLSSSNTFSYSSLLIN